MGVLYKIQKYISEAQDSKMPAELLTFCLQKLTRWSYLFQGKFSPVYKGMKPNPTTEMYCDQLSMINIITMPCKYSK